MTLTMRIAVCILAVSALCSCTTDERDLTRWIRVESNPSGAVVVSNGFEFGRTPVDLGVEATADGCFVRKTTITVMPPDAPKGQNYFIQVETFPSFRKSTPELSAVPERLFFDLTKNPETEKSLTKE